MNERKTWIAASAFGLEGAIAAELRRRLSVKGLPVLVQGGKRSRPF